MALEPTPTKPSLPAYRRNALRPNPHVADPSRGRLAYAQGSCQTGDFGDWAAEVRPALGLPPEGPVQPGGQDDDTVQGFIPAPGRRAPDWPNRPSMRPRGTRG